MKLRKLIAGFAAAAVAVSAMAVTPSAWTSTGVEIDVSAYLPDGKTFDDVYGVTIHLCDDLESKLSQGANGKIIFQSSSNTWNEDSWCTGCSGEEEHNLRLNVENKTLSRVSSTSPFAGSDWGKVILQQFWGDDISYTSIDFIGADGSVLSSSGAADPAPEPEPEPEEPDDGSLIRVTVTVPDGEDPEEYGKQVNKKVDVDTTGYDFSLVAKIGVTVSTDSYVNGCVGANIASGWGQLEFALEAPGTQEFIWEPGEAVSGSLQIQMWYAKAGVSKITAVTLYKADGNVLQRYETAKEEDPIKLPFDPATQAYTPVGPKNPADKPKVTSLYEDYTTVSGKPAKNTYLIPVDSELDYSAIAKIEARIETTDFVNGGMGANIDGTWSQTNFEVTGPGKTITWELPGAISDPESLQIQFWWLNVGSFQLKSVTFYDKDGNEVKKLAAEDADDAADADAAEEETTEEDKTEDTDKEEEDTDSEVDADVDTDNGGALAPYYSNGVVYLRTDDGSPAFCDESGVKLTDVYGIRVYAKFKAEEVADEECWIGGGIGSNSNSTGWAQVEWGRNGAKPIDIDFENGIIEWISDSPIFAADDEYAQLWIQAWGGTVEFEDVELLGKDGIVIAATYASDSDAEIDVDEATDEDIVTDEEANPNTGVALAVVPALVAAAAIVVSKKRK